MTVPLIERFPRLEAEANRAQTTLTSAVSSTARPNWIAPTSTTGFPASPGFRVLIDSEILLVTYIAPWGAWYGETVEGTTPATHAAGAAVTQVLTAGALAQIVGDHRAVGAPGSNPHPQYIRRGNYADSWMTRDWGLVPGKDNHDALQTAIDTVYAAGGGTVWLPPTPPSAPLWHRGLTHRTGVNLRGSGMYATVLKLMDGANKPSITMFQSPDTVQANAFYCGIYDLTIDGNRSKQADTALNHGIVCITNPLYTKATNDMDQDMHHVIQNVMVQNTAGTGVWFYGRGESRLMNVSVLYAQGYGFVLGVDSFLYACTAGQTANAGFVANVAGSGRLVGCKAFYCGRLIDQGTYTGVGYRANAPGFWLANAFSISMVDCEAQDCAGQGFFLESSNRITMAGCVADSNSASAAGVYAGFHLYNSDYCTIASGVSFDRFADGFTTWQLAALKMDGGDDHNEITLTHSGFNGAVVSAPVYPGSVITSSTVNINGNNFGVQIPAFAASYTPDPYSGQFIEITLTGNITVNNPASPYPGQQMTFIFVQDATGTRTVTWGAAFKQNWTPTTTAARRNTISFVYDGTNWQQYASAINTP